MVGWFVAGIGVGLMIAPVYTDRAGLDRQVANAGKPVFLIPVTDVHVPVMKFKFQGISNDLLCAGISFGCSIGPRYHTWVCVVQ